MSQVCSHTASIARPAGPGEDWSSCYLDSVAFFVTTNGQERS
jgi:hypothetical protein